MKHNGKAQVRSRRSASVGEELPATSIDVAVGEDVLELLTTGMHVDPMTIYREYIQNAADSIDDARHAGILAPGEEGRVAIDVEQASRSVRIVDNGAGVPWPDFVQRLTSIGASTKRGTTARGFRGVGRLAGLGYVKELIFRTRAQGETLVSELRWDCLSLRAALRAAPSTGDLSDLIRKIVRVSRSDIPGYPPRFFEVELKGLVRLGSDSLLNPVSITHYLAQIAPVPFSPDFSFGEKITEVLRRHVSLGELQLLVESRPVYRPHRDELPIDSRRSSPFENIVIFEIPAIDGETAAIGWVLHHGYHGAVPTVTGLRGLRLRSGNIQIGDHSLLDEVFPEPRFNAWSVGEIHIIDSRILPNGRRDNLEPNAHVLNLYNHLAPIARTIAQNIRVSSRKRNLLRQFAQAEVEAGERLAILENGVLDAASREQALRAVGDAIERMEKILAGSDGSNSDTLHSRISPLRDHLERARREPLTSSPLSNIPPDQRATYEHLLSLIYECSPNRSAAHALVNRIVARIGSGDTV